MSYHLTRTILIYNRTPVLLQLLKQQLPASYELHLAENITLLENRLERGGYDSVLINNTDSSAHSALIDCINRYADMLPILLLSSPGCPTVATCKILSKPVYLQDIITILAPIATIENHADTALRLTAYYTLFSASRTLKTHEDHFPLTEKEVALLKYLYTRQGETISKDELLHHIWGYAEGSDSHTIETHIYRLRQKIDNTIPLIVTEDNGYRLYTPPPINDG